MGEVELQGTHRGQTAQARSFSSSWSTSLFHSMCWWSNCMLLVSLSRKKIDLLALAAALMMMMTMKK
jgi:hypothetical protein